MKKDQRLQVHGSSNKISLPYFDHFPYIFIKMVRLMMAFKEILTVYKHLFKSSVYPGTVPGAWSSSYTPGLGRRGP
jgi:hypothetical protein